MRVGAEISQVQHLGLGAAQPAPIGDLEQDRVAEHRQPAPAATAADPPDLLIGVVEERLQLIDGERPFDRVTFGLLDVDRVFPSWQACTGCDPNRCWHPAAHP